MTEEWKWIPGYEGLYEVSVTGKVRSYYLRSNNPKIMSTPQKELSSSLNNKGYEGVSLQKLGVAKRFTIHRLVLTAFVGEPLKGQECRHLDGNRLNNQLSNLAWGSRSENAQDRLRHGTQRNMYS